jgi:sec-independent protein translocase protein TatC
MVRAGLLTEAGLVDKRKYAIVAAFVAAAILTPPDPVSQIGLAVPTILLYELSIILARRIERQQAAARARRERELGLTPDPEDAAAEAAETPDPVPDATPEDTTPRSS